MFPNRLKTLRNEHSWTQADLANKINVSPKTIGAWERGTREPPIETITKLSDIFGVSADYLLGKTTQKNSEPNDNAMLIAAHIEPDATEEDMAKILDYIEMVKKSKNK